MDTNLKIARCKTKALTAVPFFGAPLLGIDVVEVDPVHPQTETMCTDGKRIYYNPDVVDEWSEPELLFVMLHEVAHILWGHHLRRGNRDPCAGTSHATTLSILFSYTKWSTQLRSMVLRLCASDHA